MPRGLRLDAPGVLHHVMVRGLERRAIFRDDRDRADFLGRLAGLVAAGAVTVYAWALLPKHAHLLVRTSKRPPARTMRALLAGYAGAFNRRHRRVGHLFLNRYKSVVIEEEPYFLELVRYLHLNPLQAGRVPDLRHLDRYPWSGHPTLLGRHPHPWQATGAVLGRFGRTARVARTPYRAFVAAGVAQGRRPELQGGGARTERRGLGRRPGPPPGPRALRGGRAGPGEWGVRGTPAARGRSPAAGRGPSPALGGLDQDRLLGGRGRAGSASGRQPPPGRISRPGGDRLCLGGRESRARWNRVAAARRN